MTDWAWKRNSTVLPTAPTLSTYYRPISDTIETVDKPITCCDRGPMCPTLCVSFPRSGHHILTDILQDYFGEALQYWDAYRNTPPATGTWTKNHDFGLDTPIPEELCVVQIRDPAAAIVSRFVMDCQNCGATDTVASWQHYAMVHATYYAKFYNKWVAAPIQSRVLVRYEDLLADPPGIVADLVQRLGCLDMSALQQVLERHPIRQQSRLTEFRYYDHEFMQKLAVAAST